jgi:tetratricopeptide (TPR) repeat protein
MLIAVVFAALLGMLNLTALGQRDDPADLKARGKTLVDALRLTEALPIYEKLAGLTPDDPEIQYFLGLTILGKAANSDDPDERRQLRMRARAAFVKANQLGDKSLLIRGFIEGIPEDGSEGQGFSDNAQANALMQKGEAAFSSGKLDEALTDYQNALKADPRCYYAALFSGDVYMQKVNYADAEIWYQRAIAINPLIETAYRYSATPLMKQKKYDQARDRYIEAFIVDPYGRLSLSGIVNWGQITQTPLGHPKFNIPEFKIGSDGKANVSINLNPEADDGSLAWSSYAVTREAWRTAKFAARYPKEKAYRHSLAEEADAIRSVISTAKTLKPKKLNADIAALAKMDAEGLLEAYILLALPDQGIARDHRAYLVSSRDKLRQYVLNYVIGPVKPSGDQAIRLSDVKVIFTQAAVQSGGRYTEQFGGASAMPARLFECSNDLRPFDVAKVG